MNKKNRILIVEDEILISLMLKNDLELNGFIISSLVATGEDAVKKAINDQPDVILMDIRLSGKIDGIDAAKQILKNKYIPIIFMTGYSINEYSKRIEEIAYIAYLNKPIDIKEIINIINSIS